VLGVALFILFWVIVALALLFVALRGGASGIRDSLHSRGRGGSRLMAWLFVFTFVAFGVALPAIFLTGNHANANSQIGGIKLNADEKAGRELFGQRCGMCHTLAAANAVGKVGPNLDTLSPPESLVLHTIANGCVQNPPPGSAEGCLGQGTMPADIVQGHQAQQVAEFVARVAGRE
jgi:mono/diheme cytochrome c family protein